LSKNGLLSLSFGLVTLICLFSVGTLVFADDTGTGNSTEGNVDANATVETETNETNVVDAVNMSEEDIQMLVTESLLTSLLQQSGADENETAAVIDAAKAYYTDNSTVANGTSPDMDEAEGLIEGSVLSSLLGQLGVNETVKDVVVDYAKTHADEIGGTSGNSTYN
jgi:hypothetical protein